MEETAELHFLNEVVVVIDALPIQTKPDPNSRLDHSVDRCDARTQAQVGGGLMSHPCVAAGKDTDVVIRRPDAVCENDLRPEEPDVLHKADVRPAESSETVDFLEHGFQGMDVDRHAKVFSGPSYFLEKIIGAPLWSHRPETNVAPNAPATWSKS